MSQRYGWYTPNRLWTYQHNDFPYILRHQDLGHLLLAHHISSYRHITCWWAWDAGAGAGAERTQNNQCEPRQASQLFQPTSILVDFPSPVFAIFRLFMPLVLFVKPTCEILPSVSSLNPKKKVHMFFSVFPQHSMLWVDHHGFLSIWYYKLQRLWPRPCEFAHPHHSTPPHFHTQPILSVDCIPITWRYIPW